MVNLAMCNWSHFGILEEYIFFNCTKLGMKLQIQHSTFELILLITAELLLEQFLSHSGKVVGLHTIKKRIFTSYGCKVGLPWGLTFFLVPAYTIFRVAYL